MEHSLIYKFVLQLKFAKVFASLQEAIEAGGSNLRAFGIICAYVSELANTCAICVCLSELANACQNLCA